MKKYYPVDFDEKGNAVLGNAKSTPTSNGFISTTWAPGGSDEGKQGLKSITISPAITTTPALESLFPIYWEDLTEEQKQQGVAYSLSASNEPADGTPVTITVTPTSDWYVLNEAAGDVGEKGQPMSFTNEYHSGGLSSLMFLVSNEPPAGGAPEKYVMCRLAFVFS